MDCGLYVGMPTWHVASLIPLPGCLVALRAARLLFLPRTRRHAGCGLHAGVPSGAPLQCFLCAFPDRLAGAGDTTPARPGLSVRVSPREPLAASYGSHKRPRGLPSARPGLPPTAPRRTVNRKSGCAARHPWPVRVLTAGRRRVNSGGGGCAMQAAVGQAIGPVMRSNRGTNLLTSEDRYVPGPCGGCR